MAIPTEPLQFNKQDLMDKAAKNIAAILMPNIKRHCANILPCKHAHKNWQLSVISSVFCIWLQLYMWLS